MTMASVIACFNIRQPIVDGNEVAPEVYYPGAVGHPSPFKSQITLRDNIAGGLIDSAIDLEVEVGL